MTTFFTVAPLFSLNIGIWLSLCVPFMLDAVPTRHTHLPYLATPSQVVPAGTSMVVLTLTLVQAGTVRTPGAAATLPAAPTRASATRPRHRRAITEPFIPCLQSLLLMRSRGPAAGRQRNGRASWTAPTGKGRAGEFNSGSGPSVVDGREVQNGVLHRTERTFILLEHRSNK